MASGPECRIVGKRVSKMSDGTRSIAELQGSTPGKLFVTRVMCECRGAREIAFGSPPLAEALLPERAVEQERRVGSLPQECLRGDCDCVLRIPGRSEGRR